MLRILARSIPFVVLLAAWQAAGRAGIINQQILPVPTDVFRALCALSVSGELWEHVAQSVKRVIIGFVFAAAGGTGLGIVTGYFRRLTRFVMPLCEFLRPIPPIAWIPVAILWFGLGDAPAYFIVFVGAFFPVYIHTYWGIVASKSMYYHVARNFGLPRMAILREVILPGSLPQLLQGLRIGLGLAWTSVISAELVGAQSGLGYMIQLNRIMLKTHNIIAGMIVIGTLGFFMNNAMARLQRAVTRWDVETFEYVRGVGRNR